MNTVLMMNSKNQLHKTKEQGAGTPAIIRLLASFFSYLFHPVFIPLYIVGFMVYEHPYLFAGFAPKEKILVVAQAFAMFTFFPLVTVLLLKALKFIESFHLATQKDRIIPLVACGVWYFWIWYVWRNLPDYPKPAVQLAMAVWITASLGLMANIYMKISLHAMSLGVMVAFILLLAFSQPLNFGIYISVSLLIAGIVCTSRFIVSDHTAKELYGGVLVGIISMLIASWLG